MIAQQNQQQVNRGNGEQTRPYIYELDPLRAITAVSVIAVHVLAATLSLNHTQTGIQVQNGIVTSVHFTREVFMFVTALALTYVYYGKHFSLKHFWAKRSIGLLLPYCLWSIAYTWVNTAQHSPGAFARLTLFNILTGNASYQLYYILLAIQFYLVHVFILTALLQWVVPFMPAAWPVAFRVFLTWFLTAGGAAGISILLMKTPVLSHLVGRAAHWRLSGQTNTLHEWFSYPFHRPRKVEQKGSGEARHV